MSVSTRVDLPHMRRRRLGAPDFRHSLAVAIRSRYSGVHPVAQRTEPQPSDCRRPAHSGGAVELKTARLLAKIQSGPRRIKNAGGQVIGNPRDLDVNTGLAIGPDRPGGTAKASAVPVYDRPHGRRAMKGSIAHSAGARLSSCQRTPPQVAQGGQGQEDCDGRNGEFRILTARRLQERN